MMDEHRWPFPERVWRSERFLRFRWCRLITALYLGIIGTRIVGRWSGSRHPWIGYVAMWIQLVLALILALFARPFVWHGCPHCAPDHWSADAQAASQPVSSQDSK